MKEDFLMKSDDIAGEYGCYPGSRPVEELLKNGIIILDKWQGPTSHDVSATVRKILELSKTGHAGTLVLKNKEIPLFPASCRLPWKMRARSCLHCSTWTRNMPG